MYESLYKWRAAATGQIDLQEQRVSLPPESFVQVGIETTRMGT